MKKLLLFTTMALALVVGAFACIKVGATNYSDYVFDNCRCYGWELADRSSAESIIYYYEDTFKDLDHEYDMIEDAFSADPWINIGDDLNDYYNNLSINYFYNLIIPNVTITDSFTIRFSNSIGGNVDILFDGADYRSISDEWTGTDYTFIVPDEYKGRAIIAIGFTNYVEQSYARYIAVTSSEIVSSIYYQQGYNKGSQEGYIEGQQYADDYYNSIIDSKNETIAQLQAELDSEDRIGFRFYDLLNNIFKYPVNAIHRIFYNEEPIIDQVTGEPVVDAYGNVQYQTTTPITLFGVNIIGVVIGIVSIGLCITIIAVVKKVWK